MDFHTGLSMQKEDYHWLISEYAWKDTTVGQEMDNEAETTSAFVPGFGAMPNCHLRLTNIAEGELEHHDNAGIGNGRVSPGVGAFTPYHDRQTYATKKVQAGSELFVSYGENWFLTREVDMGLIPILSSYPVANKFMDSFKDLVKRITTETDTDVQLWKEALTDLWNIILESPYKSRPHAAIPKSFDNVKRAFVIGIDQLEVEQSIHKLDWLDKNGKCLDYIDYRNSVIPHAGRGAFAKRSFEEGEYIHIAPLVHIPDRDVLTMYADMLDPATYEDVRDTSKVTGYQPWLNYCFGHRSSSLLLCPYSSIFINHSKEPNAKIVWSTDPVFHNASILEEPVSIFDNIWSTKLSFEYIAIKDINEGDEILIDYGDEWQEAWDKHVVEEWKPQENAKTYISSQQLNSNPSLPIPTEEENDTLFVDNLDAWCHFDKVSPRENGVYSWQEEDMENEYQVLNFIHRTYVAGDDPFLYTVVLIGEEDEEYVVENVPGSALSFSQQRYGSDFFIPQAFRHEM